MLPAVLLQRLAVIAVALTLVTGAGAVAAQSAGYPSKPVRVVVPAAAGSPADVLVRLIGERVTRASPQPWVIENRPGAGGMLGADVVAKAAADGHSLLFTANNFIISPSLFTSVPYDIYRDFTPIGMVAAGTDMIFINASLSVKTLKELVALTKRSQGGVNYGAPFVGSSAHLTMEMLKQATGMELNYIPASGGPQSFTEAVAGRVPVVIGNASAGLGMVKSGRLNALVVIDKRRSALAPEVPTLHEEGYSSISNPLWFALYGPARLPEAIVQHVNREVNQVLGTKETVEALSTRGFEARPSSPAELEAVMRTEQPMFAKVIQQAGVKAP